MITTPRGFVRPEQELARLTLISSTNEAEIRRRSTISGIRPFGLGEINGAPVAGPLGPPESMKSNENETVVDQIAIPAEGNPAKDQQVSDIDSEATLVSENEENEPLPVQAAPALDVSENPEKITSAPSQAQTVKKVDPPSRPPPEPPRPAEADRKRQLIEEVELELSKMSLKSSTTFCSRASVPLDHEVSLRMASSLIKSKSKTLESHFEEQRVANFESLACSMARRSHTLQHKMGLARKRNSGLTSRLMLQQAHGIYTRLSTAHSTCKRYL